MSYAEPFHVVRNELNAVASGRSTFTLDAAHILVDQTATLIRIVVGKLPPRCAEHLAQATAAAARNTLPKFIHEVEAALMRAEQH